MRRAFYGRRRRYQMYTAFLLYRFVHGLRCERREKLNIRAIFDYCCCRFALCRSVIYFFNKKTSEFDFTPGKGMFLLSLLCAAGMFYDFIYQCVSCYDYISKTSYIAVNRVIPMVLCIISALICCAYFAILSQCSRSSRFEFGRLKILCFAPFLWVFCNVLVGLTAYGDALYDVDSALKNFCLVFGLLFFFFYAAQREKLSAEWGLLRFSGIHTEHCALFW